MTLAQRLRIYSILLRPVDLQPCKHSEKSILSEPCEEKEICGWNAEGDLDLGKNKALIN
jgi:hypothetical protein